MKKVIAVIVVAVLLGVCTGCQVKGAKSEEKLTVCVDSWFADRAGILIDAWEELNEGTEAELVIIPSDSDTAEITITKIRTEIMSGGGPDVFILFCMDPTLTESAPVLFDNPEKLMYDDVFLPLDEYMLRAEYMEPENWNQTIWEAGRTEEGQILLPLRYHYPVYAFRVTDVEDEGCIPSCWEELPVCENPAIQKKMGLSLNTYFCNIFGDLANYQKGELSFSEEELLTRAKEVAQYIEMTYEKDEIKYAPEAIAGSGSLPEFWEELGENQQKHTMIGLPNTEGGITANITMYAAVNRNTPQPENAFSLLDVFLSDEIMCEKGFMEGQHTLGTMSFADMYDASVNSQALQTMRADLVQEDIEALANLDCKINTVRFHSDLEKELNEMFYQYIRTHDEEQRKKIVHKTYDTLQMKLLE